MESLAPAEDADAEAVLSSPLPQVTTKPRPVVGDAEALPGRRSCSC